MKLTAYVFPGQASQYVGMGRELYEQSETVQRYYAQASDLLGADLARISFDGPAEILKRTVYTQPAILVHSLALLALMDNDLPEASYAAGHSLGEYGALVAAGALSAEDAISAVCTRAKLMEEACEEAPGTMAAIMGLSAEIVQDLCTKASTHGIVVPANVNSSVQVAISGETLAVEEVCRLAKETGAKRAVMLEVGGAFHSPLMASAQPGMMTCLEQLAIRDARFPVVANVTAAPVTAAGEIRELLVRQITSPVRWQETMACLADKEVETIIEIGPGKVLTGLAKREISGAELITIDKLEDFSKIGAIAR
jgi:[acyl-carrier-protein] S-malonyltransferase